jgi:hypothetical protein
VDDDERGEEMSEGQADWVTPLMESAAAMHEIFSAYVAVGFRRDEAMQVVLALLAVAANSPSSP